MQLLARNRRRILWPLNLLDALTKPTIWTLRHSKMSSRKHNFSNISNTGLMSFFFQSQMHCKENYRSRSHWMMSYNRSHTMMSYNQWFIVYWKAWSFYVTSKTMAINKGIEITVFIVLFSDKHSSFLRVSN